MTQEGNTLESVFDKSVTYQEEHTVNSEGQRVV